MIDGDKRKNMEIWIDIQKKIGINTDISLVPLIQDSKLILPSIHYSNFTRKELLKFEKAIDKLLKNEISNVIETGEVKNEN